MGSDPNTCAVMLEPIQGEGGIIIPQDGYLAKVKAICEKHNCLLIADEVQTGFGRTGSLMGYEHDMPGDKPHILTLAKSISGGVTPTSGILADDAVMMEIKAGEHGSTYGGNPLSMAVAKRAIEVLYEDKMIENSREMGAYLYSKTSKLNSPLLKEVRGRGMFQGIELKNDLHVNGADLTKLMFSKGILSKSTHDYCVRLTPALVINKSEIDAGVEIVEKSLQELEVINNERSVKK